MIYHNNNNNMTYHQVPSINLFIRPEHIKLTFRKHEEYTNYISLTLAQYLNKVKNELINIQKNGII